MTKINNDIEQKAMDYIRYVINEDRVLILSSSDIAKSLNISIEQLDEVCRKYGVLRKEEIRHSFKRLDKRPPKLA